VSGEIIVAAFGVVGVVIGAIPTYVLMRKTKQAQLGKLNAETEKILVEAARLRGKPDTIASAFDSQTTMLFVAADPGPLPKLELARELREIMHGFRISDQKRLIRIDQLWGARWEDFRRQLLQSTPTILHFSGNGTARGLLFEGENRESVVLIEAEQIQALLALFHDRIRLVFINTCDSAAICQVVSNSIDFVVGVTGAIPDTDAIRFATAFYEALADRKPIPTAFDFARSNLVPHSGGAYRLFNQRSAANPRLL
jgi:hypothetical protein